MALGTHGAIRSYKVDSGWRARTLARDYDGRTRDVERWGKTKAAAERALKAAVRDRTRTQADEPITGDTRLTVLAEAWYAALTGLSPTTRQAATAWTGRSCPASDSCASGNSPSASWTGTCA